MLHKQQKLQCRHSACKSLNPSKRLIWVFLSLISPTFVFANECNVERYQAEGVVEQQGIRFESTTDIGGGENAGWFDSGDWMKFEVSPTKPGKHQMTFRVASFQGGGTFNVTGENVLTSSMVSVPVTDGWQSWVSITQDIEFTKAGLQELQINISEGDWNLNWFEVKALDCTDETGQCIGTTIQAEQFNNMDGVVLETANDIGGGENIGYLDPGDWLSYDAIQIQKSGHYLVEYRVASNNDLGQFQIERAGGQPVFAQMSVPNTGGWQSWQTIQHEIEVPEGELAIGLAINTGGFNLNWFRLTPLQCSDDNDDTDPPLEEGLTAVLAASEMGRGFNIGQTFENTQHPPTFASVKAKIDAYYAKGFRNVRLPITWTEAISGELLVNDPGIGDVNRNSPRLAVIEQVVDYALSLEGMYVVINTHHEHTLKDANQWWVLERLWADISDIFKDRSDKLIFEILNEPHKNDKSPMAPADLRFMTGKAYDSIRQVDADRIVVIGGNQWFHSSEVPLVWTDIAEVGGGADPYVMATFHHYDPWEFSGDNQGDYADNWTDYNVRNPMNVMKEWADTVGKGMPVYIGEWGVGWQSRYENMRCNNIRAWYSKFETENAAPLGQPTSVWDDGGWFKIFDHSTNAFDNNLVDCIANGQCTWDGNERFNSACY